MPNNKLVPDIDACIGAGIEALVARKPRALAHINNGKGRYAHLFAGWKAQGNIVARRFASEAKATRLFDSGVPLQQLVASEYDISIVTDSTFAVGEVQLIRIDGTYPAGVIRRGHLISKEGNEDAQPIKIDSARYEVSQDVLVAKNQTVVTVPIKASRTGANSNIPFYVNGDVIFPYTQLKLASPVFDTNFSVTSSRVAGGSQTPVTDKIIRRAATAFSQGRYAPTEGAILAGALLYSGVANLAVIENESNARTVVFPVDESWAYSDSLNATVGQYLKDNFCGFGCAIQMGKVYNQFIHIDCTVKLFNGKDLIDTTPLQTAIKDALASYFDDRPDWWTWKSSALKSVIAGASRKIYACTSVSVTDALSSATVSEPGAVYLDPVSPYIPHYFLPNNAVNVTFLGPT